LKVPKFAHSLFSVVLSGRLGLAVFPIFTLAAVFRPGASAAGRGTGRGTISGLARGGMSLEIVMLLYRRGLHFLRLDESRNKFE
jgi:hypothetical protein